MVQYFGAAEMVPVIKALTGLGSRPPHGVSGPFVTLVSGDLTPSLVV